MLKPPSCMRQGERIVCAIVSPPTNSSSEKERHSQLLYSRSSGFLQRRAGTEPRKACASPKPNPNLSRPLRERCLRLTERLTSDYSQVLIQEDQICNWRERKSCCLLEYSRSKSRIAIEKNSKLAAEYLWLLTCTMTSSCPFDRVL
jgi:hypothetical protein